MEIWLIVICLVLSAYFSGTETVFLSVNRIRLQGFLHRGIPGAKTARWFLRKPSHFLLTTLVGNNLVIIAFSSLLTAYLLRFEVSSAWITPIAAVTILIMGEVIPKSIGRDLADPAVLWVAPPLQIIRWILYPLIKVFGWISSIFLGIFGVERSEVQQFFSRRDLEILIREGAETGALRSYQETHISRILQFRSLIAREVMTPRTEIIALEENSTPEELRQTALVTGYSKILIYREDLDHVFGLAYAQDLFEDPKELSAITRPISFFPEQKKAWEIFRDLRAAHQSIAIIVDEWGGTSGLITIEDLLEELMGEIEDEYDPARLSIQELGENRWLVSARMEVEEINRRIDLEIPEGEYETLGGYLIDAIGRIPQKGEVIELGDYRFTISKATRTKIRVVILEKTDEEASTE
jgi:CBS domain containing-hemolysin-like protein